MLNHDTPPAPSDVGTAPVSSALDEIVQQIDAAFQARDFPLTLELLNENLLQAWFGMSPEDLMKMMLTIKASGQTLPPTLAAIHDMMMMATTAGASPSPGEPSTDALLEINALPSVSDEVGRYVLGIAGGFALRLQGRPVEAQRLIEGASQQQSAFQTLFAARGSLDLFSTLQAGLTAMLAGDFELAEAKLAESKLHPTPPSLPFLTRDAHSKSAVLHACFGDPMVALAELAIADQQPRTNSWIETVIDAQTDVARALVQAGSPQRAIETLDKIPLSTLGEMWPFYAFAVRSVFERAGQPSEAIRRLEILDRTRLPRVDRQGFTGSVLPSMLAISALAAGNPMRARELWERVDPDLVITMLGSAVFALSVGDAREAARLAMELRGSTRTMRQLELWRLSLLAASLMLTDDHEGCLEVLRSALALPRGLTAEEAGVFHERVRDFARQHLEAWPATPPAVVDSFTRLPIEDGVALTTREFEVLEGLSRGLTREQVANELFLSVNTVKAHQQTLYRKLGVSSRNAAVIEGEQRGLL